MLHKTGYIYEGIKMKIYGSPYNLTYFNRHFLKLLHNAGMDYQKALPQAEVFLGGEYSLHAEKAGEYQLFYLDLNSCRNTAGFLRKIGRLIQKKYLPHDTNRWQEIENMLGYRLDRSIYSSQYLDKTFCPAEEIVADIFEHTIEKRRQIMFTLAGEKIYPHYKLSLKEGPIRRINLRFDHDCWRKWFYKLWD